MALRAAATQTSPRVYVDVATQTVPWPADEPVAAPAPAAAAPEDPTPPRAAFRDVRWYVVWRVPGRGDLVGIHEADGLEGWRALERRLPTGRYVTSGAALRRAAGRAEAIDLYASEAQRHRSPLPPRFFLSP